jgi:hypothetical protein
MHEQIKRERFFENTVAVILTVIVYFIVCWIVVHFVHIYPVFVEIVIGFPFVLLVKLVDICIPFQIPEGIINIAQIANVVFWPLLVLNHKLNQQKKSDEIFKE